MLTAHCAFCGESYKLDAAPGSEEHCAAAQAHSLTCPAHPLRKAVELLTRAYHSGHREGWEDGPSVQETMSDIHDFLCNIGRDPAEGRAD